MKTPTAKNPSEVYGAITAWIEAFPLSKDSAFLARYLGTPRPVHAIKTAQHRSYTKELVRSVAWSDRGWTALLDQLYSGQYFEHRLLAGMLLASLPEFRARLKLNHLEHWLAQQTGWCEIDVTCQSGWTPEELLARWPEWRERLNAFAKSPNISLRRASLVLLVSPLRASSSDELTEQAFTTIRQLGREKEGLITKAISWVLRSMTRLQPDTVRAFLDDNEDWLPKIAIRETRRKLDTGRKSGKI